MSLANYGASEAVNLCSRHLEKSTNYSEHKCASYFREKKTLQSIRRVCKFFPTFTVLYFCNGLSKNVSFFISS
jgi:hypothetical protein